MMLRPFSRMLRLALALAVPTAPSVAAAAPNVTEYHANRLPPGPLSTSGNQIIGADGQPVRILSVGVFTDILPRLHVIAAAGFNTLRVEWGNRLLYRQLPEIDHLVEAASRVGLRVILDDHYNEGVNAPCFAQQANGLWYDFGGATDGTDGCRTPGSVSDARFVRDWETIARHFKGNETVIGYDLWNEPLAYSGNMSTWQPSSANPEHNLRYMDERVGNAILAIDPTKLIICEGPQDYHSFADPGKPAPWGDLSLAGKEPVVLAVPNKLIYSVHDYPKEIGGFSPDSGPRKIALMTASWGYLVAQGIAPVWIGEMGANMKTPEDAAWADTLISYANGTAEGAGVPRFDAGQQGIGIDWWFAGFDPHSGNNPSGIFDPVGGINRRQQAVYTRFAGPHPGTVEVHH